ncbi:MAG: hypothetical protein JWM11_4410 [Planctomycetaceae bacterium]|nr:hypothetical protein [Planctomycetaceae bacterium]
MNGYNDAMDNDVEDPTLDSNSGKKLARAGMNVAGGAIPFVGGFLSAAANAWSEHDQERINSFFKHWLQMLADEMKEKERTIFEIAARLDVHDESTAKRMASPEYQSLLKKAFREWPAAESEIKRQAVRNILANAAATTIVSDDVVKLFLDWLKMYSEFHFQVISAIYNNSGVTRAGVWNKLGKSPVREDSAEADLFKLLIRDLSTGGIIRQHAEVDYYGNKILKTHGTPKGSSGAGPRTAKSAFDDEEQYELTGLGQQFVHYALTDLPPKIEAPRETMPA